MARIENYYDILGVSQTASEEEIRVAENAMRKLYDHKAHLGDTEATDLLARLNEANATLTTPHQRAEYDRSPKPTWEGYADLAQAPPIVRGERLRAIRDWMSQGTDLLREATLLDRPSPLHLLRPNRSLGDE
jgi:curved DNA-binding protein CbpA